ncbi:MAG TPA: alpha/beta hydrolase [Kofleriaceae bacterium]|nr:alpha/beta hydrolase [Kofleriaceae bacterium]
MSLDGSSLAAGGHRLEAVWHGAAPGDAPTMVFLHEGLGSVSTWRDVPAELARITGCGALVYSRAGYGASDPVAPPRPLRYMHDEAELLPAVLDAAGVRRAILIGHSDGASIAILHAGSAPAGLLGLVLEAPHVFVEEISVASIAAARDAYQGGDLRERLARHHRDVDGAFWGWNRAWLDPGFRAWNIEDCLPRIRVPILAIQGIDDPYGTLAQIDAVERGAPGPTERLILPDCGHAPHRDQRAATLEAIARFVRTAAGS